MPKEKRPVQDSLRGPFCFFRRALRHGFPIENDAERRSTKDVQLFFVND